jgi:hypothetical protein
LLLVARLMWQLRREAMVVLCLAAGGLLVAQDVMPVEGVEEEWAPPPGLSWQPMGNVRVRGGYKDNVLLSSFAPVGAPFVGASLEAFVWRPLGEEGELDGVLVGEHRQFVGVAELDFEQTLFGLVQVRRELGGAWRLGGAIDGMYLDQVLDLSATEDVTRRMRVRGGSFGARPSVRRGLGAGWLELQVAGNRQVYVGELLDDHWQVEPRLTLGWPVGARSEVAVAYEVGWRWYDEEPERTSEGEPIPGTRRRMTHHDVALTVRHVWGEDRQWRLTGRVSGRVNEDGGSGYFDYVRPQGTVRLRYRARGWELEAGGRATYYGYRVQRVNVTEGELRRRVDLRGDIRAQRRIYRGLSVFLEYEHERTLANRRAEEYRVHTVSGGLDWEF